MSTRRDITDPTTPLLTEAAIDAFRADGADAWVTIGGKSRRVSDLLRVLARRVHALETDRAVLELAADLMRTPCERCGQPLGQTAYVLDNLITCATCRNKAAPAAGGAR